MASSSTPNTSDLNGYLNLKVNTVAGTPKTKAGKRYFVLQKDTNSLEIYKSQKDVDERGPIESVPLYRAAISFGKDDENEFIVNVLGVEYCLSADNHRTKIRWMNILKGQVDIKPAISSSLENLVEDETLVVEEKPASKPPPKRPGFFQRLFGGRFKFRSSSSNKNRDGSSHSPGSRGQIGSRTVQPAHLRPHVVGSMQDISTKEVTCKKCILLEGRNSHLEEQVRGLNDDLVELRDNYRKTEKKSILMEKDQLLLKREFVDFLLNILTEDNDLYTSVGEVSCFKQVVDLMNIEMERDRDVPMLTASGFSVPHEDELGFIHGNNNSESPVQLLVYACSMLKRKYSEYNQESNDVYQQWVSFAANIDLQPGIVSNSELDDLIRYGIPPQVRKTVWKWLIEQHVKPIQDEKGKNYYQKLVSKLSNLQGTEDDEGDTPIEKQIKIDLLRTMPTHKDYQTLDGGKVPTMHRVLRAFLMHNPEVGYCQGMNFMVGFALLYLDEEDCFWLLVAVTEVLFSEQHYNTYLTGTQANQRVFQDICRKELPLLTKHLENKGCELGPITFNWFMTIFIESLSVEVVLNIWDCFLVHGHPILYKFGLCILKTQRKSILKEKDAISIMRGLKKFGRIFSNGEKLVKDMYSTSLSEPMDHYLSLYDSYVLEIQEDSNKRKKNDEEYEKEKEKLKFTPKPMMVSVSDNLDELDDDLVIKCAQCEENRNFVWVCASSDLMGQIFVLNVSSRQILPIEWQVDSRCLAMDRVPKLNIMLVSTMKSFIHAIDVETKKELWKKQLAGCALSICCGPSGNVVMSLMDGSVAFINIQEKEKCQSVPTYIDISRSPVFCGCLLDQVYWCGADNKILLVNLRTLETTSTIQVCPNERHVVNKLVTSEQGVWNSLQRCSVVHLWHKTKFYCLLTVDVLDACGLSHEKRAPSSQSTIITSVMALHKQLFVGFGNGRFIICDVCRETEEDPGEDDIEEAFNVYKSSMENITVIEHVSTPHTLRKNQTKLGLTTCCHDFFDTDSRTSGSSHSLASDDVTDYVMVDKRTPKRCDDDGMVLSLKMSQIQRVSEQSVTQFVPCRNDGKLILSCMGALNDDSSVILWNSQKEEGRKMWFAQTVSYAD